jgi:PBP1b-binding outer membrane lipoprotein LpoB
MEWIIGTIIAMIAGGIATLSEKTFRYHVVVLLTLILFSCVYHANAQEVTMTAEVPLTFENAQPEDINSGIRTSVTVIIE